MPPLMSISLSVVGCARCHGEGHDDLTFLPLTHPVECPCGDISTHWAPCPGNGEPILVTIKPVPE